MTANVKCTVLQISTKTTLQGRTYLISSGREKWL